MKALTVWQPWASLILIGAKPYEFRGWKPPRSLIGHRIAIHAGARPVRPGEILQLINMMRDPVVCGTPCLHPSALDLLNQVRRDPKCLPLSHIVCTAVLGEPKPGDLCAEEFGEKAGNDSDRDGTFNWGWPLTAIHPLEPPIPMRGAQGLWNWNGAPGTGEAASK